MLGLDFNQDILFGNKLPLPEAPSTHGVYSNDMLAVCEFNDQVAEECDATQLFTQISQIQIHSQRPLQNGKHQPTTNTDTCDN